MNHFQVIFLFFLGELNIITEFRNGNLTFKWDGDKKSDYVKIKLGTNPWRPSNDWFPAYNNQYTVADILKYPYVQIKIDETRPYSTKTYHGEIFLLIVSLSLCLKYSMIF
jgi:hypothetical protein